jgi:hypothetical protein
MVEYWQSRRLNSSTYPSPNQLLTAPVSDFYDPSRGVELRGVERETFAAYKRMVAAAVKDKTLNLKTTNAGELAPEEKFLKIVSSFRSREYQAMLRRQSPNSDAPDLPPTARILPDTRSTSMSAANRSSPKTSTAPRRCRRRFINGWSRTRKNSDFIRISTSLGTGNTFLID